VSGVLQRSAGDVIDPDLFVDMLVLGSTFQFRPDNHQAERLGKSIVGILTVAHDSTYCRPNHRTSFRGGIISEKSTRNVLLATMLESVMRKTWTQNSHLAYNSVRISKDCSKKTPVLRRRGPRLTLYPKFRSAKPIQPQMGTMMMIP